MLVVSDVVADSAEFVVFDSPDDSLSEDDSVFAGDSDFGDNSLSDDEDSAFVGGSVADCLVVVGEVVASVAAVDTAVSVFSIDGVEGRFSSGAPVGSSPLASTSEVSWWNKV